MEELISIVFDIRVWVTIILGIIVNRFISHTPKIIRGYWKSRRLKNLRKVRKVRVNPIEVTYEIAKANSYFIFFALIGVMYSIFLIMGPLGDTAEKSILLVLIIAIPLYVVEIMWLLQDKYAQQLVKASRCIHVTSLSCRRKKRG